ncbi:hypothetical protein CTA2_3613 [Colletotrichum tanaceti]|nr:hypothetical protein CTA2_3613 [Colletotrichum tanaceti]
MLFVLNSCAFLPIQDIEDGRRGDGERERERETKRSHATSEKSDELLGSRATELARSDAARGPPEKHPPETETFVSISSSRVSARNQPKEGPVSKKEAFSSNGLELSCLLGCVTCELTAERGSFLRYPLAGWGNIARRDWPDGSSCLKEGSW